MQLFKKSHGVYAAAEMKTMIKFQRWKDLLFLPMVRLLTRLGVSASVISIAGALVASIGLFLSATQHNPLYFVIAIWIHFFLDGIDGALARHQHNVTLRGMLLDTACDLIGIIACSTIVVYFRYASAQTALFFTALYVLVTIEALILGAINTPYPLIIRPRIYVFIALTIDVLFGTALSTPLIAVLTVMLGVFCIQGFWMMGSYLKRTL